MTACVCEWFKDGIVYHEKVVGLQFEYVTQVQDIMFAVIIVTDEFKICFIKLVVKLANRVDQVDSFITVS